MADAHNYDNYQQSLCPKTDESTLEMLLLIGLKSPFPRGGTAAQQMDGGGRRSEVRWRQAKDKQKTSNLPARRLRHGGRSLISQDVAAATEGETSNDQL
jgi:hypothetical protein